MNRRLLTYSFSLLNVDHVQLNRNWNYTNVISPYFRLYYIDEGMGRISSAKENLILEPGYMYIIPSFTLCSLSCPDRLGQLFIQFFEDTRNSISLFNANRTITKIKAEQQDIANFKRILAINPGRGINRSDNPKVYEKDIYYKEYQELNNQQTLSVYLETQGIILQLLSRFVTPVNFKHNGLDAIPSKILDTISYIQVNLNKDLSVAHLAERANQHPDYFSRKFMQYTGARPVKYIQEKRIERAQYFITTMNMPYAAIAAETGFENLPYFSRMFKKITGITPGEYRRQHQNFNTI